MTFPVRHPERGLRFAQARSTTAVEGSLTPTRDPEGAVAIPRSGESHL